MFKILSQKKCFLGEGLYVSKFHTYWVDIVKCKIFSTEKKFNFKIKNIPSVIFYKKKNLVVGTNKGIYSFANKNEASVITSFKGNFDGRTHRSNDGCYLGKNKFLIGIMPKKNFKKNGKLLLVENDKIYDLKLKIKIPNTFINLGNDCFLISDSYSRTIYKIKICLKKKVIKEKEIFYKFKKDIPDGGCLLSQKKIAITIWNSGKIVIFDKNNKIIKNIKLPVEKPTNCKFSVKKKRLFITSAVKNLKEFDNKTSLSGHTFYIDEIDALLSNH
jgi:D-xylonolactonase